METTRRRLRSRTGRASSGCRRARRKDRRGVAGDRRDVLDNAPGKRGFLYEEWAHGGLEWERILATGPDCSRLEKRFLEEERAKSERHFRQEYLCELVQRKGAFSQESIDAAFQDFEPMKI